MTYQDWEEEKDRELDASLTALFQSVPPPQPNSGFAGRTLKAVRRQPLPAGRRALRKPLSVAIGWGGLIAGTAVSAYAIVINLPFITGVFASLLSGAISVGVRLLQFVVSGLALSDVFTTTGLAVARVVTTREGSASLMLMAVIGALSLSALYRLLFSEGKAQWQELS